MQQNLEIFRMKMLSFGRSKESWYHLRPEATEQEFGTEVSLGQTSGIAEREA